MCAGARNCSEGNEMGIGTIVMLAVSLLLLIYLTVALLRPEKF
jgi:K+-transporting ATPase KdpF subunit